MKHLAYYLFNFFFLTHFAFVNDVQAQNPSIEDGKDNEVTITIKKNINGEESESTSTFSLDDLNLEEIMNDLQINMSEIENSLEDLPEELKELDMNIDIKMEGLEDAMKEFEWKMEEFDDGMGQKEIIVISDENPNRGFLGVIPKPAENGVAVAKVLEGTGAEEAGLMEGDILRSVGGNKVTSMKDLFEALGDTEKGESIKVKYSREGKKGTANVVLSARPAKPMMVKSHCMPKPSCHKESPTNGFLGIFMNNQDENVVVEEVIENTAASKAGLKSKDILKSIDGQEVKTQDDVFNILKDTKPGDKVSIMVNRNGETKTINAELGKHKPYAPHQKMEWTSKKLVRPFLGVSLDGANDKVKVLNAIEGSPAEKAGIQAGDLILSIDNVKVNTVQELIDQIRSKKSGDDVEVMVDRNGELQTLKAVLENKEFSHCGPKWDSNSEDIDINLDELDDQVIRIRIQDGDEIVEKIIEWKGENGDFEFNIEDPMLEEEGSDIIESKEEDNSSEKLAAEENNYTELIVDNFTFYPNPNNGKFRLTFSLQDKSETEILITDSQGKEVFKKNLDDFSGEYDDMIDISDNSRGTYILQISQGNKTLNRRIVIQ